MKSKGRNDEQKKGALLEPYHFKPNKLIEWRKPINAMQLDNNVSRETSITSIGTATESLATVPTSKAPKAQHPLEHVSYNCDFWVVSPCVWDFIWPETLSNFGGQALQTTNLTPSDILLPPSKDMCSSKPKAHDKMALSASFLAHFCHIIFVEWVFQPNLNDGKWDLQQSSRFKRLLGKARITCSRFAGLLDFLWRSCRSFGLARSSCWRILA